MFRSFLQSLLKVILKQTLGIKEQQGASLQNSRRILIVRQHNQLGDMLVGSSLINALYENFPGAEITFVASPQNKAALENNPRLAKLLVFDKKKLFHLHYIREFWRTIRQQYDLCLAPATVSISFTNDLIARLANARIRVGVSDLDGKQNEFSFFFHHRVSVDWRSHPETHVAKRILGILAPFGITTSSLAPVILPTVQDEENAKKILALKNHGGPTIGLHTGAGKPPNRWPAEKFYELIERLHRELNAFCYLTASSADFPVIQRINDRFTEKLPVFLDQSIGSVAALVSHSDLFITNDTGIMHVAAAVPVPQISLFGPTDPRVWGPASDGKINLQNADGIEKISVDEVFECAAKLLKLKA